MCPTKREDQKSRIGAQPGITRREFLTGVGTVAFSAALTSLPQRANALYNMGAFWKRRLSTAADSSTATTLWGSGTKDPYWDYVTLLTQFDGGNGSTVFADESNIGRSATILGSPFIDRSAGSSPYSGRTGSVRFNGSSDRISYNDTADFEVTGDFTVECWVKTTTVTANQSVFGKDANSGSTWASYNFSITNAGTWRFSVSTNNSGQDFNTTFGSISINTWYHVAVVRSSGSWSVYINGSRLMGPTATGNPYDGSGAFTIGQEINTATSNWFNGWMADFRVYKGFAKYTANFTAPTEPMGLSSSKDTNWAYTVLASPFENSLKDMSGKRPAVYSGSPTISTAQSKFGGASLSLPSASSSYVKIDDSTSSFTMGTMDFTIEMWVRFNATPSGNVGFFQTDTNLSSSNNTLWIGYNSGKLWMGQHATSNSVAGAWSPVANTWYHIAVSRRSGTGYVFVNGSLLNSGSFAYDLVQNGGAVIGSVTAVGTLEGYIDSLRVTRGFARYTATFTPPSSALPVGRADGSDPFWSSTVLAMRMDNFNDSTGRHTITNNGTVTNNTSTKIFGTGSASFNGSNYLSTPASTDFDWGSGDFTIEAWIQPSSTANQNILGQYQNGGGNSAFFIYIRDGGKISVYFSSSGETELISNSTVSTSAWTHICIARASGKVMIFINGVLDNSMTYASSITSSTLACKIGNTDTSQGFFSGFIDDVRMTKGVARYVQGFTPPVTALPTS